MEYKFIFTTYDVDYLTRTGAGWFEHKYTNKDGKEVKEANILTDMKNQLNDMVEKEHWRIKQFTATPGKDKAGKEKVIYTIMLER